MGKTRILQFTIAETKGGRTQYLLNIWNWIDKTKFQFDFITFSKTKLDFENALLKSGAKVFYLSCHPEDDLDVFKSEFRKVLLNGYDAIEIHTSFWVSTIVEELACDAKIPKIIIHAHSTGINAALDEKKRDYHLSLHNKVRDQINVKLATHFWACSKEAAEWLYGDRIPPQKIEIIPNTIDTSRFGFMPEKREKMRSMLGIEDRFVFGFIGRLERVKNVDFAIRIFEIIRKTVPKAFMLIVGDGSLLIELKKQCERAELRENVLFVGLVDNVEDYLQAIDLYLLPSKFEAFPISLLEAQCSGLSCITSMAVPEESVIDDKTSRCPLEESIWVKTCEKYLGGYERVNQATELKKKGFDTETYIHVLEERYLE